MSKVRRQITKKNASVYCYGEEHELAKRADKIGATVILVWLDQIDYEIERPAEWFVREKVIIDTDGGGTLE